MKRYIKSIMTVGLFSLALTNTSCIEETEPTTVATQEQAQRSSTATKAQAVAIPAVMNAMDDDLVDNNSWHGAFAYPSMMIIRNMMDGDSGFPTNSYAAHFYRFGADQYLGGQYIYAGYIWSFYYGLVQSANAIIDVVDPETAASEQLGFLGAAYAYRALAYIEMAQMYEFLPNDKTTSVNADGNDVTGLTVPIVKEGMTEDEARHNPRAKHDDMVAFIKSDLAKAHEYITHLSDRLNNTMPDEAAVYGLEARFNLWTGDYSAAATAAQKAIDLGPAVLTEAEATDVSTGMNLASQFMWAVNLVKECDAVQSGIVNWTSWMSNQTTFGYTGAATGQYMICDKNMYDRIPLTDWRKKWWQAPEGSPLRDQTNKSHINYLSAEDAEGLPAYASIKFRPGAGNTEDYNVGSAIAIPVMRVEEMYLIKAEAEAHSNPAQGLQTLKDFMTTYRDANYVNNSTTEDDVVEEVIFQKRVELWGEGLYFFDLKRLNYSVTRGYADTPFFDQMRLNTEGRPAWTNIVISVGEYQDNQSVNHWNNPDPSDLYKMWKP